MSINITNSRNFEAGMRDKIYQLLAQKSPQIQIKAKEFLSKSYAGEFSKDPVETGQAKDDSDVTTTIKGRPEPSITVIFTITGEAQSYAIYFLEPLSSKNPNLKYGKRNTIKKARDNLGKFLGIK